MSFVARFVLLAPLVLRSAVAPGEQARDHRSSRNPGDRRHPIHFGDEPALHFRPGRQTMVRWGIEDVVVNAKLAADRIEIDTRGPEGLRVQVRYELKKNGEIEAQITSTRNGFQRAASVTYVYVRG